MNSYNVCVECHALEDVAERGLVERCKRCEELVQLRRSAMSDEPKYTVDDALQIKTSHRTVTLLQTEVKRLRAENAELIVKNEQLYKDRYDALSVHTKEGMLASEWLLRTGKAERRVKELEAENAELRKEIDRLDDEVDALHQRIGGMT